MKRRKQRVNKINSKKGNIWTKLTIFASIFLALYWLYDHRVNVGIEFTPVFGLEITNKGKDSFTADLYYRIIQENGGKIVFEKNNKLPLGQINAGENKLHKVLFEYSELKKLPQGFLFLEVVVRAKHDFFVLHYMPFISPYDKVVFYYAELSQNPGHWRSINSLNQVPGHKDLIVQEREKILKSL